MVGMSHKTTPVDLRECFSLPDDRVPSFLDKTGSAGIEELVYVSTCNRVEIYAAVRDVPGSMETLLGILEEISSLSRASFEPHIYRKYSRDAVLHLLKVAASLDSMVVGENEILSQVKKAYRHSIQKKRTGIVLNKLFHQAFRTAKRVRTETEIAHNPLSIAYIATELAKKIYDNLSEKKALLVGAGEMGELILKYFTKQNVGDVTIANRSLHNAERIALEINREAHIIPLEDIGACAAEMDIIITSASSPVCLLTSEMLRETLRRRGNQPLFLIDIAVPRNIDPAAQSLPNIFLYNVDDLESIADENLKNRLNEVEIASRLVESDTAEFMEWYEGLEVVPAIVRIQNRFDEIRNSELRRYRKRRLKHLSEEDFRIVEDLTNQIMTKTLHNPIMHLKRYTDGGNKGHDVRERIREKTRLIEELFDK